MTVLQGLSLVVEAPYERFYISAAIIAQNSVPDNWIIGEDPSSC